MRASHAVAEHDVLLGEFQQHGVIEELVDADIFAETLRKQPQEQRSTPHHHNRFTALFPGPPG